MGRCGSQQQQQLCSVQGSDGEKDRRYANMFEFNNKIESQQPTIRFGCYSFRKKLRTRGKDPDRNATYATPSMRPPTAQHHRSAEFGVYDRPDYDTNESPLASGGGYRGSRRRLDSAMSNRATTTGGSSGGGGGGGGTYDKRQGRSQQHSQHQHDYDASVTLATQKPYVGRSNNRNIADDHHQFQTKFEQFEDEDSGSLHQQPPQQPLPPPLQSGGSAMSRSESNKFSTYDEQGFESDFNSPPSNAAPTKSLRFSNDFSASQNAALQQQSQISQRHAAAAGASVSAMSHKLIAPLGASSPIVEHNNSTIKSIDEATSQPQPTPPPTTTIMAPLQTPTPKLRFDECVTVVGSNNAAELFEDDDFSKAEFSFEATDQWNAQLSQQLKRTLKGNVVATPTDRSGAAASGPLHRRQQQLSDNIRKSESVNIFAKKHDDPFEDDDFFKVSSNAAAEMQPNNGRQLHQQQQHQSQSAFGGKWDNDFAKFDENI